MYTHTYIYKQASILASICAINSKSTQPIYFSITLLCFFFSISLPSYCSSSCTYFVRTKGLFATLYGLFVALESPLPPTAIFIISLLYGAALILILTICGEKLTLRVLPFPPLVCSHSISGSPALPFRGRERASSSRAIQLKTSNWRRRERMEWDGSRGTINLFTFLSFSL